VRVARDRPSARRTTDSIIAKDGPAPVKADEFIREVEEELQWERLARLWRRFGPYVISLAVLVVLGTAAKVGYESWRDNRLQAEAKAFAEAERLLARAPEKAAEAWMKLASEGDDGFATLARLRAGAAWNDAGKREQALAALEEAARQSQDPLARELAQLFVIQYRLDTGDPRRLAAELEPLAGAERAYRHAAREMLALVLLRAGERDRARDLLRKLAEDATAPDGQRQRVRQLLELLGGGEGAQVAS